MSERTSTDNRPLSARAQEIQRMLDLGEIQVPVEVRSTFARMAATMEEVGIELPEFVKQCNAAKAEADKG